MVRNLRLIRLSDIVYGILTDVPICRPHEKMNRHTGILFRFPDYSHFLSLVVLITNTIRTEEFEGVQVS